MQDAQITLEYIFKMIVIMLDNSTGREVHDTINTLRRHLKLEYEYFLFLGVVLFCKQ